MKTILLTGAAGRIGAMLHEALSAAGKYRVIATARNAEPEKNILAMNILDYDRVNELMRGVDVVVHMAAYLQEGMFHERALPNNVAGVYNLYEAMRQNGAKRMVYGSTNHVVGFYRDTDKVTGDSPQRPDSVYGLTKAMAETIGRMYSDKYGISCINVRIGSYDPDDHVSNYRRTRTWISRRDLAHLIECAVEAPEDVMFLNVFGVSGNAERFWDIGEAQRLLGYKPQDDGHEHLEEALRSNPDWHIENGYMGFNYVFDRE